MKGERVKGGKGVGKNGERVKGRERAIIGRVKRGGKGWEEEDGKG